MTVYALDERTGKNIHLFYVQNIKNLKGIRDEVLSGGLNYCLVKPEFIVHPFQIVSAANRAALKNFSNSLVTKSLNTELLFNLSPSRNITQALKTFGVTDTDNSCLIIIFGDSKQGTASPKPEVDGVFQDVDSIGSSCDQKALCKLYKITEEELKISSIEDAVISRVAVKGVD